MKFSNQIPTSSIKNALSCYMFFLKEQRNLCISSLPEGMSVMKEVVKEVANIWSTISEE